MQFSLRVVVWSLILGCALASPVFAVQLNIGQISVIDTGTPGVYTLVLDNYTGDPNPPTFGTALPPDFPVFTPLTLQNIQFTLVRNLITEVYALPDQSPGSQQADLTAFDPNTLDPSPFAFTDLDEVDSITLTATITPFLGILDNLGNLYDLTSASLSVTLLPLSGPYLTFGDLAVIQVQANQQVPEPSTALATISGLILVGGAIVSRRRRQR